MQLLGIILNMPLFFYCSTSWLFEVDLPNFQSSYLSRRLWGLILPYDLISLFMINIKDQSRLKVLQKFYYSKRDSSGHTGSSRFQTDESTTLNRHLIQNDVKFQCSVFIFWNRGFHAFVLTKFPLSVQHFILSIPDYRHINFQWFPHFPIIIPIFMERVLGCNQSKCPWHSFVCSVAPEDDHLLLMLSCWCSVDLLIIFFFASPLYTDPHEYFNLYTPG